MRISRLIIISILVLFPLTLTHAIGEGSRINMGVSPIRHDFTIEKGQTLKKEVSFFNNSDTPYNIYLTTEDCFTDDGAGTPKCRLNTRSKANPDSISSWITYDGPERFIVPPKAERKLNLIITAPADATPGGHYGALFFNNPDNGVVDGNTVKMVKRTGILLLANVPGKIVYDTEFGEIGIDLGSAPNRSLDWIAKLKRDLDPRPDTPVLIDTEFGMNFALPVSNKGNTHILPVGRIELYDDDVLLQKIGKESIRNEDGVFLGEQIVDYLPINDEGGNVLPNSERVYTVLWKGFAYEEFENGKKVIKFLSPSEYYSQKSRNDSRFLLPWEKLKIIDATKIIKARIHLEYKKTDGTVEPYDREQYITVAYSYVDKGVNWGALFLIILLVLIIWVFWLLLRRDDDRVEELEDEVHELESELSELEKGRRLAKSALEKKKPIKAAKALSDTEKKVTPTKKTPAKKSPGAPKKVAPIKAPAKKKTHI